MLNHKNLARGREYLVLWLSFTLDSVHLEEIVVAHKLNFNISYNIFQRIYEEFMKTYNNYMDKTLLRKYFIIEAFTVMIFNIMWSKSQQSFYFYLHILLKKIIYSSKNIHLVTAKGD